MISVSRTSFHNSGASFTECYPSKKEEKGDQEEEKGPKQICGCTHVVCKHPPKEDTVHQVKYCVYLEHNDFTASEQATLFVERDGKVKMSRDTFTLWFRKDIMLDEKTRTRGSIYCTVSEHALKFQYSVLDYGFVDCAFFTVNFGKDSSWPVIKSDDAWMYKKESWGNRQSLKIVTEQVQGDLREIFVTGNKLLAKITQALSNVTIETKMLDIYTRFDKGDSADLVKIVECLDRFDLENHPLFSVIHTMDIETDCESGTDMRDKAKATKEKDRKHKEEKEQALLKRQKEARKWEREQRQRKRAQEAKEIAEGKIM